MTSRILPTPTRNNLHGTDIFPLFARSIDISLIIAINQHRKIDFSNVYSFYAYTPEQLEKATYILSEFDLQVNENMLILRPFLKQIDDISEMEIRLDISRMNGSVLREKRIKYWLDLFYTKSREKSLRILSNNGRRNIFFDILQLFLNEIIKKINKIISIRRRVTKTIPLTIENRDTLLIYGGLYTSMFIYMLHLFFGNKFMTSDSNVILPKNPFYDILINQIYDELTSIGYGLPRIQDPIKKIGLKNITQLETDILSNSLPTAPTRGGKKKINKKLSKKLSKKVNKK